MGIYYSFVEDQDQSEDQSTDEQGTRSDTTYGTWRLTATGFETAILNSRGNYGHFSK